MALLKSVLCLVLPVAVFSQFISEPVDTVAYINDPVILNCSVQDFSDAGTLTWSRGPSPIYFGSLSGTVFSHEDFEECCTVIGDSSAGDFTMKINAVSFDDAATWKCDYTADPVFFSKGATVKVLGEMPFCEVDGMTPDDENTYQVIEGSTATLLCNSDATPPGELYWTKDGEETGQSGNSPAEWTPTFTKDDANLLFNCEMRHPTLKRKIACEEEIYFDVQFAPTLTLSTATKDVKLVEGSNLLVTCEVTDTNPDINEGSLGWTTAVAGVDIPSDNNGILDLMGVTKSHAGDYVCSAQNTFHDGNLGTTEETIQIDIQYPPVLNLPNNSTLKVGDSLNINCSEYVTEANPAVHKVKWIRFNTDIRPRSPVLSIEAVQRTDFGMYSCEATNSFADGTEGKATANTEIYVQYAPIVTVQSTMRVKEGGDLEIRCTVTSDPAPEIVQWFTESSEDPVSTEDVLKIPNVGRGEAGEYTCNAKNKFYDGSIGEGNGKTRVIIEYPPVVTIEGPDKAVSEGKPIQLNCTIDSEPKPLPNGYTWKVEQGGVVTVLDEKSTVLDLGVADASDTGNYTCIGSIQFNDGSTVDETASIDIVVKTTPKISNKDKSLVNLEAGKDAVLQCQATAYPDPQFQWSNSSDGVLANSDKYTIEEKFEGGLFTSTLTIAAVQDADYGLYRCTATNDVGTDTFQVELKPVSKPSQPTDVKLTQSHDTIAVAFKPGYDGGEGQTFTIEYSNTETGAGDKVSNIKPTGEEVMNYTLTGLKPKTEYKITVLAVNDKGTTQAVPSSVKTNEPPPTGATKSNSTGIIVAIVIIIIILIILIIVLTIFVLRRRRQQQAGQPAKKKDEEMPLNDTKDDKGVTEFALEGDEKKAQNKGKGEESEPLKANEEKPDEDEKIDDGPKKDEPEPTYVNAPRPDEPPFMINGSSPDDSQPPEETKIDEPENEAEKEPEKTEEKGTKNEVVYAELDLAKPPEEKPATTKGPPTEYATIDFARSSLRPGMPTSL
ncbi:nephrin-like isoform X3 [Glandiceps talaboti]